MPEQIDLQMPAERAQGAKPYMLGPFYECQVLEIGLNYVLVRLEAEDRRCIVRCQERNFNPVSLLPISLHPADSLDPVDMRVRFVGSDSGSPSAVSAVYLKGAQYGSRVDFIVRLTAGVTVQVPLSDERRHPTSMVYALDSGTTAPAGGSGQRSKSCHPQLKETIVGRFPTFEELRREITDQEKEEV